MKKKMGALDYALYLLKMRDRGTEELRQKMKRKEFSSLEIEEVIKFLTEKKFLDDKRFAENFIKSQSSIQKIGKYKIKLKLIKLFINSELIESSLKEISASDEEEIAKDLAQKWLLRKKNIKPEERYQKLGNYLVGKGFGYEVVKSVLNNVLDPNY